MNTWPLDRIAHLNPYAFAAIVQSILHTKIKKSILSDFIFYSPDQFMDRYWEDFGLLPAALKSITEQCNNMFHTHVAVPGPDSCCRILIHDLFQQWNQGQKYITFLTSGTTGPPASCTHRECHLRQEITSVVHLVENQCRVLVTVPVHHIYGLTLGLLLPLTLGVPVRFISPLPTLVKARMQPGDIVIGIPLLWSRLSAIHDNRPETGHERTSVLFTAASPMPPEVMQRLMRLGFRVMDFFGYSEVGLTGWRTAPDAPFELLAHVAKGTGMFAKNLVRLLPDEELRYYPLMDHMTWVDARHFYPGSRIDKAVQVGGVNVYPQRIASILEQHEGVETCLVRLMRPDEGQRLKAFVVPKTDHDIQDLRESLLKFTRKYLKGVERPACYTFGEEIPIGNTGKPSDW